AGAEYMAKLARNAGFQQATVLNTDGKPGVFATLDAGAKKTVGLYFMYDVKQFDPAEWTSPPLEARIIDKPGIGKAIVGRGAVNQKGPEAAFLAALHAIRGAGKTMPVNLVMVAEGEEEIGSPHIGQLVHRPDVEAALRKTVNIEGLVGGYTGPGGKTILPHRAVAKIDMRLVPDMKFADAGAALKAHLAKHGFGDVEVNVTGGYDPTATAASAPLIQAQV